MKTDSERGVWFPPRPRDGGTPISFVGAGPADAELASSDWIIDSTSSIHINTFSGFKSVNKEKKDGAFSTECDV